MHSSVLVFAKILAQQGEKWFSSRAVDPCAQNPSTAVCRNRFPSSDQIRKAEKQHDVTVKTFLWGSDNCLVPLLYIAETRAFELYDPWVPL